MCPERAVVAIYPALMPWFKISWSKSTPRNQNIQVFGLRHFLTPLMIISQTRTHCLRNNYVEKTDIFSYLACNTCIWISSLCLKLYFDQLSVCHTNNTHDRPTNQLFGSLPLPGFLLIPLLLWKRRSVVLSVCLSIFIAPSVVYLLSCQTWLVF